MKLLHTDIPKQPQFQGSLADQLFHLMLWANRLGMYDAADWIAKVRLYDSAKG